MTSSTPSFEAEERTVKIPVQWIDGQWQLIGGGPIPALRPNVVADLVFHAHCIVDEEQRARWTQEQKVDFLTSGATLFARISGNGVPEHLRKFVERREGQYRSTIIDSVQDFVRFELCADVSLYLTPGKMGKLSGCKCEIESLDLETRSINQALTRISQAFEPRRVSYGGNVFSQVFVEEDRRLVRLEQLRQRAVNAAARGAARPPDRCDTWIELGVRLSQIPAVWEQRPREKNARLNDQPVPLPRGNHPTLEKAAAEFYDFRTKLLIHSDNGLDLIQRAVDDPKANSSDITRLRELYVAIEREVLKAYGWHDLAERVCYDFLLDDSGNTGESARAIRFRWPDDFRGKVLYRLLQLEEEQREG